VAYRADIEIAVKGAQELKRLQDQVSATSKLVDGLNNYLSNIGDGGVVRNINNLNAAVAETAAVFNKAALGTDEATIAAKEYLTATNNANAGLREKANLLAQIQAKETASRRRTVPGDAGTGQQTPALPPQLIKTYEIGKNWVTFFQDAAAVAVDLKARSLNTQKNWNDFFATAAQAAVNVKANSLNTKASWNDFFATAAQAAVNVKANSLNTKASWNDFFATAAQAAVNVKANSLNTKASWNDFFATAAQAAVNVKANSLNTKASWNDFFATAAQAAVNVKANALNTKASWNNFFATAAQAAVNVKANALNTKASWNDFFATAAQAAVNLKANSLNTKASWNDFFATAAQAAVNVKANALNTKASWNKFFAEAPGERRRLTGNGGTSGGGGGKGGGGPAKGLAGFLGKPGVTDAMMGAGFPLLFGAGPGAILGGGGGGFLGGSMGAAGGPAGMALGIALSAVGQTLDQTFVKIADLSKAADMLNVDGLRDSVLAVNSDLDVTVERLIKAGQANAAQTEIAKQVTLQTGLLPEQTAATSQAVNGLGTAWNEVVGAVSGLLSIIGTPFVTALAVIAQGIAKVVQGINYSLQLVLRTAPLLALQGKLVTAISNALPAINEEQEKIRAEIEKQTDSYSIQIGLALKVEAIDKRRNKGNSVAAKINNNELDRQEKQLQLNAKVEKEIQDVRLKNKGQDTKLLEDQIKGLAEIEKREINRATARQRERLELEKINEQYGSILKGLERTAALGEQRTLLAQLAGALTEEEAQILNTLNEQSLVIDTILAKRRQLAELEQGGAGTQQLSALVKEITALENKTIQLDIQVRKESLEQIRRDLESATAAANRQLDIQVNTIQGQNTLYQSQLQLLQAQNSLSLQRIDQEEAFLRKTIETTDNVKTQEEAYRALFVVAEARYKIALFNIKIERAATIAEIESRLQLLDIEVRRQQIKYEELRVLALEAKARGILKQAHLEALQLQGGVVELQKRSYNFAVENAGIQRKIADTFYRQKVEAAGLAYNQEVAALRTERLASGMERAASASMSMQNSLASTTTRTLPYGAIVTDKFGRSYTVGQGSSNNSGSLAAIPFQPFAKGGMVTKPTLGLIGEGGENEFIIPQSKAAGFAANYLSGARGASAIPSGGGGDTMPTINIQTGPVMQQGGQNYVSMPDMERALETLATTLLTNNRTPGGRRFQGVN
jgi:hypothetical protein